MTISRTFAGYDQPDCASVQIGSVKYRAYSYRVARYVGTGVISGVSVRVRCMVEQPNAQQVELFDTEVATGNLIDSPKMIAVGTTLVVCWIQLAVAGVVLLHMATLDLSTLAASGPEWTDRGSVNTHDSALFDLVPIDTGTYFTHHATDYIVVHRTDVDEFSVRRHNGFDWLSMAWIEVYTAPAVLADSILAATAFEGLVQQRVLVTYQTDNGVDNATGIIRTARFNIITGLQTADTQSFAAIPGLVRATQATHRLVTDTSVVLAVEYVENDDLAAGDIYVRWIAAVLLDGGNTSQLSSEQAWSNLHILGRAFGLPGLSDVLTPTMRVFLPVGFKNMGAESTYELDPAVLESGTEWVQSLPFILDLDWQRWGSVGDLEARPFIVAQMPFTIADCRVGGTVGFLAEPVGSSTIDARRCNHLSHVTDPPDFGPSLKSMTFAHGAFARVQNVGISTGILEVVEVPDGADPLTFRRTKLVPVASLVRGWEFNYEDPWLTWRDGRTEPDGNWVGVHELAQHQALNVGRHMILGGSTPTIYDGVQVVELGFPWDPEIVSAVGTLEGGGGLGLGAGTYTYVAFYEWADAFGAVHRSGPSAPVSVTLGDVFPDPNFVELRIRTMTVSLRDNLAIYPDAHSIHIVVYRTEANGSQLYRLHCLDNSFMSDFRVDNTPRNDPTTWAITVDDGLPDETLLAVSDPIPWPLLGGALDTQGLPIPLEPNRVPAGSVMAVWQERLFIASMEDSDELRFSLALQRSNISYRLTPEFNDVNVVRRDNLGPVTGMVAMDQQLIVLTPDRIYSVVGRVPNDTGTDGDLSIHLLAEGVGCICPRSVAVTAGDGVFFQSRKGYYQLDRGGNTAYVGADVEDYINEAGMVLSATVKESQHQVRLVCNTAAGAPVVLIYDYLAKLWSRSILPQFADGDDREHAAHGVMWRGLDGEVSHVLLEQGGAGFERARDDVPFSDQDETGVDIAIPIDVQTSWIHVADIGGLQRIRRILLTLDKPNASQLTVTLEFDQGGYDTPDLTQNIVFAAGTPMPLRCCPQVQKCTAFRIRIRETGIVATTENLSISAITLIAGVKRGHSQVPEAQIG